MPHNFVSYRSMYLGNMIALIWGEFMPHDLYFSGGGLLVSETHTRLKKLFVNPFCMAHSAARNENH